jgi:prepilin-type N-terminal cleavage/methylation domain-containing protein
MIKKNINNRAFTLLELLIVIGVLAILTAVVILVLNPTEMLQKSRDSRRLSELADLNRALQIASVQGIFNFGSQYTVYISIPDPNANPTSTCSGLGLPTLPLGPPVWSYQCSSPTNYRKVNSTGWVPVNFSSISIGSPLATLPVDPINTVAGGLYYTYTRGSWVLTAPLESPAYQIKYATPSGTSTSVYVLATETSILTPEVSQVLLTRGGGGGGGTQQCSGTDTSCGTYPTCQNCDSLDGCTGTTYRDYYCSSQSCFYTDYPNDSRCQAPGDSTPPVAGTVTPANTSSGSYVDTPFDVSTVFTDNESAVASCEYTINGGTNWYVATISGSGPNYTCSKNNISSFDGTVLTINMRATSGGGTTTATSVSRTVDGAAPTDGPLIATPGDQQISLSWAAATDSGSGLAGSNTYKLVFSTTATPAANCTNGTQIYLGAGTSKDHTGLTNGTTYYYRVCAYDAVNNISIGATDNAVPTAPGTPFLAGYTKRKKITIDNTYIDVDLSNFPLYIKINSDANMSAARSDGYDIRFTSSDGLTLLSYERESWSGGGGSSVNADIWVKVSTIDDAVNTDIYIYYGKSDATDGSVPANVWDTNFYMGVWHLTNTNDSTSNGNNGTAYNQTSTYGSGKIAGAYSFDGTNDWIQVADSDTLTPGQKLTISAWLYDTQNDALPRGIVSKRVTSGNAEEYYNFKYSNNHTYFNVLTDRDNNTTIQPTGRWFYLNTVFDGSLTETNRKKIYSDSILTATLSSTVTSITNQASNLYIGILNTDANYSWKGYIDEVRVLKVARSAEWIKFEYYNINQADNELTWGAEE